MHKVKNKQRQNGVKDDASAIQARQRKVKHKEMEDVEIKRLTNGKGNR